MPKSNKLAIVLIIISLILLFPGLTMPILSIHIGAKIPLLGNISLHDTTQSIISTIQTLFDNNNALVGFLILLFSVMLPIIKAILLLSVLLLPRLKHKTKIYSFVSLISKWSMADVFVVGVFLAFLATRSDDNIHAQLHQGFYYFTAYCIISIIAIQFITLQSTKSPPNHF